MKRWVKLIVCLFLVSLAMVPSVSAASAPAITVGRVYYIEGDLLRYVPEEKDWVSMVKDAPFGTEDTLFSGNQGMAEMIVPNGTWVRIGDNTQIQFIALDTDLSEMDIASGVARFYNKSSRSVIKATSSFGYVLANPGAVFDFYVGENSVEVVAVKGKVSFIQTATNTRYDVSAGSPSILADQTQVSSGEGAVDPDWNQWNSTRENFWAAKARVKGKSFNYLPPSLQNESYALEENGRWESVPYEGSSRWFWRPTTIAAGWSPFTTGRWTDWDGDQVWIPAEPFGYVTHHYGNWIYIGNRWYWAPPVASVRVRLPLLNIGFFWNPGRVSWIHSGAYVGWVPLAPRETYYSHRNWGGPHEVVVTNVNITQINVNIGSYAYAGRAIIVPRDNFYGVNSYRNVQVARINPATILKDYRAAPVVNNTVINNYTTNKQRYNFTNEAVKEKPHNTVINRIEKNAPVIQREKKETAVAVQGQVKSVKEGKVNHEVRIEAPKITNYVVPANEMNRPKSEIKLQQKEIKGDGRGAPRVQPGAVIKPEPQSGQPAVKPERVAPARPVPPSERVAPAKPGQQLQPGQPGAKPERVAPARPVPPSERVAPVKPGQPVQPGQPAARPERVAPARPVSPSERVAPDRPAGPAQSTPPPERVAPARPGQQLQPVQPGQPAARPERVAPARPVSPSERVAPDRPAGPAQSTPPPERVAPARPGQQLQPVQPGQPAAKPERVAPARPVSPPPPDAPKQRPAVETPKPAPVAPTRAAPPPQPVPPSERVAPLKPVSPPPPDAPKQRPAVETPKPAPVAPTRAAPPPQPVPPPERVAPAKPVSPLPAAPKPQPAVETPKPAPVAPAKTERPPEVTPAKPAEQEKPVAKPEQKDNTPAKPDRVAPAKPEQQEKDKEKVK